MSWEDYREFELVYRENARLVYRFLVSRGCPPQEAEDLTQDTFVKALLHIHRFKGECRLSVWLCQIAKNTWLTHETRRRREPFQVCQARGAWDSSLWEWLDLVERLEEPYRSVFVAKALEERPYEELSAQYGKSESWARVTYHRAREKLRAMIEEGEK